MCVCFTLCFRSRFTEEPGNDAQTGGRSPVSNSSHDDSPKQKMTRAQFLHAGPEQGFQAVVPSVLRVPFAPACSGLGRFLSPILKLSWFSKHPQGQRGRVGCSGLGCCPLGWRTISQVPVAHQALILAVMSQCQWALGTSGPTKFPFL